MKIPLNYATSNPILFICLQCNAYKKHHSQHLAPSSILSYSAGYIRSTWYYWEYLLGVLNQWFSMRGNYQYHRVCLKIFLVVTSWVKEGRKTYWHLVFRVVRMLLDSLQCAGQDPSPLLQQKPKMKYCE